MNDIDLEKKRLGELARRAAHTGGPVYTKFLEPALEADCAWAAGAAGVRAAFFGGYPDAERRVAAFLEGEDPPPEERPIAALRCSWHPQYGAPGHRDLLGALMGLGIAREELGDILVGEGEAYVFAMEEIADYICANLDSAGRTKLKAARAEGPLTLPEPKGVRFRDTVASERLDAVVAAGYNLSRAEAQRLIRSGLVKRNHVEEERTDVKLEAGDLISVRGYGRLKVLEFPGMTRKGRYAVVLFRYGG